MIYFVQAHGGGAIKIGYAANVLRRVTGLQTSHEKPLRVIRVMDGDKKAERAVHDRFAHLRIRNSETLRLTEWFNQDRLLLRFIAECGWPLKIDYTQPSPRGRRTKLVTGREQDFREAVAVSLRGSMAAKGMSRPQVAAAVSINVETVNNILAAKNTVSGETMARLIKLFGADFFNGFGRMFGVIAANEGTEQARALEAVNKLSPALDALAEMVAA